VDITVEMLKLKDRADKEGQPIAWERGGMNLAHSDWVVWKVTNNGREAVDVSLLFVDSGYGITAAFPRPTTTADNRLLPKQSIRTNPVRINAKKSAGAEHMVVIAVQAEGAPVDLTDLARPSLPAAQQATRGDARQTLDSPLGKLFRHALYADGTTRGADFEAIDKHALRLLSWRVVPLQGGK
jgi:hypothetical protein